jgi:hypothetical protein
VTLLWRECRHVYDPLIPPTSTAAGRRRICGLTCGSAPGVTTRDRLILEACGPRCGPSCGVSSADGEAWGVTAPWARCLDSGLIHEHPSAL